VAALEGAVVPHTTHAPALKRLFAEACRRTGRWHAILTASPPPGVPSVGVGASVAPPSAAGGRGMVRGGGSPIRSPQTVPLIAPFKGRCLRGRCSGPSPLMGPFGV